MNTRIVSHYSRNIYKVMMGKFTTFSRDAILGMQFLMVAIGATVLVPLMVGIDPSLALLSAGAGTLVFHLVTKGKVPIFLGSSFAFIAPIVEATRLFGWAGTVSGIIAVGLVYGVMSAVIRWRGIAIVERLFPSIVVGPVIIVIGLSLAPVGIEMASTDWLLALIVLVTALAVVTFTKGFFQALPVFIGVVVGYLAGVLLGRVDFTPVQEAAWLALPRFTAPELHWGAILYLLPVALAPLVEHVGDIYAVGTVAGKNFIRDPGLHRTLLGDGVATSLAGVMGSVPNTTYSEVTGAISLTRITNPHVIRVSAILAILFAFVAKISGLLRSIPDGVLGGITILLFGMIASVGIKTLVDNRANLESSRNQLIVAIILVTGVGGAAMQFGTFTMAGIGLSAVAGVLLNLLLPGAPRGNGWNQ